MLAQLSFAHLAVACALSLACAFAYYVVQWTRHELRIRKIGGTRAPSLASNPLTGPFTGKPRLEKPRKRIIILSIQENVPNI